ncbi:MAG: hypothetical protein M1831_006032 [Alyxoria varia]|nr:MAG: hypothetical protein M1831_006032 [Alyxoria varia]
MPPPRIQPRAITASIFSKPSRAFSHALRCCANDPLTGIIDAVETPDTPPAEGQPIPSRHPSTPSDARNPALQGYPSPRTGRMTNSTATADTTSARRLAPGQRARAAAATGKNGTPHDALLDVVGSSSPGSWSISRGTAQNQRSREGRPDRQAAEQSIKAIENQFARSWIPGDIYAPHDLSPVEQLKARSARMNSAKARALAGSEVQTSRKKIPGGRDVLDELNIDPRKEYKNFAMLGEFVTDMGRIRHSKETGLRARNQRRMAKAVRRAVGLGLIPSVHRHPELFPERKEQRSAMLSFA